MKKQHVPKILYFTLIVSVFLAITVIFCIRHTSSLMTEYSFQRLTEMTEDIAEEYRELIITDTAMLNSMASLLSLQEDFSDTQAVTDILNLFDHRASYFQVYLVTPDQMLLEQNGQWTDVSERLDFAEETQKAPYISGRTNSFLDPDILTIYVAVPVIRNEETVAILYTNLLLQEASANYHVNCFEGNAFVLIVDGTTGDVLVDTWHDSLGNLTDYSERNFMLGDTVLESLEKMTNDQSGDLAFTSKTRGKTIYLHYEPIGFNHLSAMLGVLEDVAMGGTKTIANSLYFMAILIFTILIVYIVVVVIYLLRINHKIYHMSVTDQATGLQNRSAYEAHLAENRTQTFSCVACIYIDANGLHELNNKKGHAAGDAMLAAIADAMRQQWPHSKLFRIGGDEFVVFPKNTQETVCSEAVKEFCDALEKQNYSVSVGLICRENETGLDQILEDADAQMLRNKAKYHEKHDRRKPR